MDSSSRWFLRAGAPPALTRSIRRRYCHGGPNRCQILSAIKSDGIAAAQRCSEKRRHVSMRGWLALRPPHRRPPLLRSIEAIDSGAASRGESGHPTLAREELMLTAASLVNKSLAQS